MTCSASEAADRFLQFWQNFDDSWPYVHPRDRAALEGTRHAGILREAKRLDFSRILDSEDMGAIGSRPEFSLLPAPYIGDIRKADIFVLLLNPGFAGAWDFYSEASGAWRNKLVATLRQNVGAFKFPNIALDPHFCWTGAYQWWERKLKKLAIKAAEDGGRCYRDVWLEFSCRIACLELSPYHSRDFGGHEYLAKLPSADAARGVLKDYLLPRAASDTATVVITRGSEQWGINPLGSGSNVICYKASERRGASLGPSTAGGDAILKRLGHPWCT